MLSKKGIRHPVAIAQAGVPVVLCSPPRFLAVNAAMSPQGLHGATMADSFLLSIAFVGVGIIIQSSDGGHVAFSPLKSKILAPASRQAARAHAAALHAPDPRAIQYPYSKRFAFIPE